MGDAYLQLNIYDRAIDAYQRILSIDGKNISGLISLATVYVLISKLDKAITTAESALKLSPGNINAFAIIAAVYERQREVDKIITLFKSEIDSGNRNPVLVVPYAWGQITHIFSSGLSMISPICAASSIPPSFNAATRAAAWFSLTLISSPPDVWGSKSTS